MPDTVLLLDALRSRDFSTYATVDMLNQLHGVDYTLKDKDLSI